LTVLLAISQAAPGRFGLVTTRPVARPAPAPAPATLRGLLGPDARLSSPGGMLLPLRLFLGLTFLYAGVSKLLDRNYLDPGSPLGVHRQMLHAASTSPIGGLVTFTASHSTATGLLIAFGEIAVGLGVLLGLFTRLAAVGGMVLALGFFLTVSWTTTPYYYGADVVFLFAFTPILIAGDGGVLSVQSMIRRSVRDQLQLPPVPTKRESLAVSDEVERRVLLRGGILAGVVGAVSVGLGSVVALQRRRSSAALPARPAPASPAAPSASAGGTVAAPASTPQGTVIAKVSNVQVGHAKQFTDQDGNPAYLLHPSTGSFVAFSAVCTHQGCPVQFDGSGFQCPCHGASFDASGQVTGGPAPSPLTPIRVSVSNGDVVAG
jgi:thiosulfate dehydrogenase (quinone) large subunit